MMAPDPSVFAIDDDHSSALFFRSRLFPALDDYHIKPHAPNQTMPREVGAKSRRVVDRRA